MASAQRNNKFLQDLGDGLILRRARIEDTEALAEFNARIHSEDGLDQPDERISAWTRDLLVKKHPSFQPDDFTVVEDIHNHRIVSSLNLISQIWTYAGIPVKVGRPELVGTHPDYRKRGLVRAQFDVIHRWSAERGELLQVITGIPYYYRLFGYEMAMNLGGGRVGYLTGIPKLEEGQEEPYRVRPARETDLDFIALTYEYGCRRSLMACQRDKATWQYELQGHSHQSVNARSLQMIEDTRGDPVGFLAHPRGLWGPGMPLTSFELKPGVSWLAVTPSVVRYLHKTGISYAERDKKEMQAFFFGLGSEHPSYQAIHSRLPRLNPPYALYIRVADLPSFLREVRPALEKRLAESIAAMHCGELKISFYRQGLRFVLKDGKIEVLEAWTPEPREHSGDAIFPGLTFLQLVFGYRTLEELEYNFADLRAQNDAARVLLNTFFPKQASDVWPVS